MRKASSLILLKQFQIFFKKAEFQKIIFFIFLIALSSIFIFYTNFYKNKNFNIFTENLPIQKVWQTNVGVDYYSELSRSFLSLKTYFLGPYDDDVKQNNIYPYSVESYLTGNIIQDGSFYNGKYYLYHGPLPSLPYIFIKLTTSKFPSDQFISLICTIIALLLFITFSIYLNKSNFFKKSIDYYLLITFIFFIIFFNPYSYVIYKFPIAHNFSRSLAIFLSLISFFYIWKSDKFNSKQLLISNFFAGCAFLCKYNFSIFYFIVFFISLFRFKKSSNKWLNLPLVSLFIVFIGSHLLYNYFRFDSFFEFGIKYQVNSLDIIKNGPPLVYPESIKTFLYIFIEKISDLFFKGPNLNLDNMKLFIDNKFIFFKPHHRFYIEGGFIGILWVLPSIFFTTISMFIFAIKNYKNFSESSDLYIWLGFYLFNILLFIFIILTNMSYVTEVLFSFLMAYLYFIKRINKFEFSIKHRASLLVSLMVCIHALLFIKL